MYHTTKELFEEIKKLIPGLPNDITHLELILDVDSAPVVKCMSIIRTANAIEDDYKVFTLTVMEPETATND